MDREDEAGGGRGAVWRGPERRRHRRYPVTDVRGVLEGRHSCEVLLLSEGGMLLRTRGEVGLGKIVSVELWVSHRRCRGLARVVFTTGEPGGGSQPVRRVGLELVEMEDEDRSALRRLIREEGPA